MKRNGGLKLTSIFIGPFLLILFCLPGLSTGQSLEEAKRLNQHVIELYHQGRYQEAIAPAKRALAIKEKALGTEHPGVAISVGNLAKLYYSLGDYSKADPLYNRALAIVEKALGPDHPHVATSLNNLAVLYKSLGDYSKAEPLYNRALAIYEKALGPEHPDVATSLNNLAALYYSLGDYSKAEPLFNRALAIYEKALGPEHPDVATSLNNLAALYKSLGDYSRAEPLNKRALAIKEKALGTEHPDVATSLNNLALLYESVGDYSRAEPLNKRALAIWKKALGTEHPNVATSLNNLAGLYLEDGRLKEAFKIFKHQRSARGLGRYYLIKRDYRVAEDEFLRSLKREERTGLPKYLIPDYIGLGLCYEGQRDYRKAREYFGKAIDLIEKQWASLSLSARQNFLAGKVGAGFSRLEAFDGMVRVILKEKKEGYAKDALLYAERVKSRTFLEMLATRGARGKGKEDSSILDKDRRFQQEILTLKKRVSVLEGLAARAPEGDKKRVEDELEKVASMYESFIKEVKLKDAELASLISVEAMPVKKVQSLLDPDTSLLEYYSTQDTTYAWLVGRDEVKVYEIALAKKDLEKKANDLLLPNISNKSRRPEPAITLVVGEEHEKETSERQRKKNRKRFHKVATDFYRLLMAPIERDIKTDRLIIVPHGVLHKVPFAALTDGSKYLCDKYAMSVLPASSVIEYIVKKRKPDQKRFLAFANPVTDYVPLGFSELEVKEISRLFAKKEIYAREKATEAMARSKASGFDVIHFACHGEFNDRQPLQSGLLLAKDEDNDGYLQVHEIFGLDLKNANLVTLSACETALGKIQGGDDLVGLSRGFIYAGTPSILATLWEVDDRSTALFMESFYKNWQQGMSKPEALRQAQIALKSMPAYKHPYYWAPFVMIGDWM